jgi:hypothetical protein
MDTCIDKIILGPEYKNKQEVSSFLKRKKEIKIIK